MFINTKEKIINYVNRGLESALLKKEKDIIENKLFHSFELIGQSPSILKVNLFLPVFLSKIYKP